MLINKNDFHIEKINDDKIYEKQIKWYFNYNQIYCKKFILYRGPTFPEYDMNEMNLFL